MPPPLTWLAPALTALVLYGLGQGLVKKYIADVAPARFCLFFVVAKAAVNMGYFFSQPHPPPFAAGGLCFLVAGISAYLLDGIGWILYFKSILSGPITIVGTLSAAYPAFTVVFARVFLHEELVPLQYVAVALVIGGCIGLSYEPSDGSGSQRDRRWIPLALAAVVLWGAAQTVVKYSYGLPGASDANLALFNTIGGFATLGVYGWLYGRASGNALTGVSHLREWLHAMLPMGMMAGGDLGVIIASEKGPISLVTPVTGAYPVVTVAYAAFALGEHPTRLQSFCIVLILVGMVLSPGP